MQCFVSCDRLPSKPTYHAAGKMSMLPAAILQPMKREELYLTKYRSENEFRKAVADDIERYNTHRPHTTLQYKTPLQVEADFQVAARK